MWCADSGAPRQRREPKVVMGIGLLLVVSVESDGVASLLIDLQSHLHTSCIYLIGTAHEKWLLIRKLSDGWRQAGGVRTLGSFLLSFQQNRPLFVLLSMNNDTLRNLEQVSEHRGIISRASWLFLLPNNVSSLELLKNINIPLDCLFLVFYANGSITDVYRVGPETPLLEQQWGIWTFTDGLVPSSDKSLLLRRQNLLGYTINATSMHAAPLVHMNEKNLQIEKGGLFGDVWMLLENMLNFSTRYEIPSEKTWGTFYSANNTSGMVGMLAAAKAEVAVFNMLMTSRRLDIMDFSVALLSPAYYVYFRKPEGAFLDWKIYIAPFNMKLWCVVVVLILSISLYVSALYWFSRRHGIAERSSQSFHVYDALFVIFATFCLQGIDSGSPQVNPCRIVYLTAYLTSVILLASYSATLVSFLTVPVVKLPFTSLEGLLYDGSYALGMLEQSTLLDYFQDPLEQYYKIWKALIEPEREENLVQSTNQGLKRLCNKKYAFLTNFNDMVMNIDNTTCEMISLPQAYFKSSLSFGFAKNSSYREMFNYHLLRLRKEGILQKFKEDLYRPLRLKEAEILRESNKIWVSVSLGHLTPILLALLGGIMLGVTLLAMERFHRGKQDEKCCYRGLQLKVQRS